LKQLQIANCKMQIANFGVRAATVRERFAMHARSLTVAALTKNSPLTTHSYHAHHR
jgi:hypothetical protein